MHRLCMRHKVLKESVPESPPEPRTWSAEIVKSSHGHSPTAEFKHQIDGNVSIARRLVLNKGGKR